MGFRTARLITPLNLIRHGPRRSRLHHGQRSQFEALDIGHVQPEVAMAKYLFLLTRANSGNSFVLDAEPDSPQVHSFTREKCEAYPLLMLDNRRQQVGVMML